MTELQVQSGSIKEDMEVQVQGLITYNKQNEPQLLDVGLLLIYSMSVAI